MDSLKVKTAAKCPDEVMQGAPEGRLAQGAPPGGSPAAARVRRAAAPRLPTLHWMLLSCAAIYGPKSPTKSQDLENSMNQ